MTLRPLLLCAAFASTLGLLASVTHAATSPSLLGRILLQVESRGEAWYVSPKDGTRIYLQDGLTAYQLMRQMSVGVTNANLQKIPVGYAVSSRVTGEADADQDGLSDAFEQALGTNVYIADTDMDGYSDKTEVENGFNPLGKAALAKDRALISRLRGQLLLQTEGHGEVWYLNPIDQKRYYLRDGQAAYELMRRVGLGITNAKLNAIPVANTATAPSIVNCENDMKCFIRAAQSCSPARTLMAVTLPFVTATIESTSSLEIRGPQGASCQLFTQVEELRTTFSSTGSEVSPEQQAMINEMNRQQVGKNALCPAPISNIVSVLNRWNEGAYSTEDYPEMNCRGTLMDPES